MNKGRYDMGERKVIDKKVFPLSSPVSLSPAHLTNRNRETLGNIPIGVYKGVAAFWDLDKAVNQPGVLAEQKHILGILDAREEERDLLTILIEDGVELGTDEANVRKRITVPSKEVWYVNAILVTTPADDGGTIHANWRCSLWPDIDGDPKDDDGQTFYADDLNDAAGDTWYAEFGPITTAWAVTNKTELLRLPGGTKITFNARLATANATGDLTSTLKLYGFKAKKLVD